jgi:hypothetical protein
MKRLLVFVIAVILLGLNIPVQAEDQQENLFIYLPVIFNARSSEPVWVLNPELPEANGWPGWAGTVYEGSADCPTECYMTTSVESPPWYFMVIGTVADVSPLGRLGEESFCYGVLATHNWQWTEENPLYFPTGQALTYWWWVPDPSLAPPLEWAAQMREKVLEQGFAGCTDPDIGVYYLP